MGLPQVHRLRHWRDFKAVYQGGIRRQSPHLTLRALQEYPPEVKATRLGISVSQKVSKKAVVRNRIKRQLRAAFRQLLPQIAPGWKIVLIVKPEATKCKYEHFLRELEQLFKKAEIINGY